MWRNPWQKMRKSRELRDPLSNHSAIIEAYKRIQDTVANVGLALLTQTQRQEIINYKTKGTRTAPVPEEDGHLISVEHTEDQLIFAQRQLSFVHPTSGCQAGEKKKKILMSAYS